MTIIKHPRTWADISSLRAGTGHLRCLVPESLKDLQDFLEQEHPPLFIAGNGTNLIGSDLDGLHALKLPPNLPLPNVDTPLHLLPDRTILASTAHGLTKLLLALAKQGLGGCSRLAGIPGTLGGALAMNAGALGLELRQAVLEMHGLAVKDGTPWTWNSHSNHEQNWGYRTSPVPNHVILTHARLSLQEVNPDQEIAAIQTELNRRQAVTPKGASIGSIFRNPPGDFAGRLLQEAGCQEMSQGPFSVSLQHANWIVNLSRQPGPAQDCVTLLNRMREAVQSHSGITLVPECRIISPDKLSSSSH